MRMIWGFIGLLIALAIVAMLVKKQIGATRIAVPPAVQGQGAPIDGAAPTARTQGQQVQQQFRQQLDTLMQQPRALPDDTQ